MPELNGFLQQNMHQFTSFDETGYQIKVPSNQLKLALWIESERMLHAQVEEIGVETQRGVVKEERAMRYDNTPYGSIMENLAKYVGAGTPYALSGAYRVNPTCAG